MRTSLIITAYDKHDLTVFHVKESMKSSLLPGEIIVVNDGGDPKLKEMLIGIDKKCPILYARVHQDIPWNYTGARNLGVWLSSGDLLIMEDKDNIPSKEVYKLGVKFMEENPDVGRLYFGRRPKVYFTEIQDKEMDDWPTHKSRIPHQDTHIMRRESYLKIKGCDERFAGRYAWASSDWRRRMNRAGIVSDSISFHYFSVVDGESEGHLRRKSYKNYGMARERLTVKQYEELDERTKRIYKETFTKDGTKQYAHTQSPIGILNFTYDYELL